VERKITFVLEKNQGGTSSGNAQKSRRQGLEVILLEDRKVWVSEREEEKIPWEKGKSHHQEERKYHQKFSWGKTRKTRRKTSRAGGSTSYALKGQLETKSRAKNHPGQKFIILYKREE